MEILIINNYKTVANVDLNLERLFGSNTKIAEVEASKVMRNKKLRKVIVLLLGLTFWYLFSPGALVYASGIDAFGIKFWGYVKRFARYGCLIMAGVDVVKNLNGGDTKSIAKVVFKYILAYAVIVLLPSIFDEIDRITF